MRTSLKTFRPWKKVLFIAVGLASLIWFLIRVIPKPDRAFYPCQRAAFPMATSFVIWLMAASTAIFSFKKARQKFMVSNYTFTFIFLFIGIISSVISWYYSSGNQVLANTNSFNNIPTVIDINSTSDSSMATPVSRVSIVKAEKNKASELTEDDIEQLVRTAVYKTDEFKNLIKDNMSVVIKPNIVSNRDYSSAKASLPAEVNGITTDWRVIKAIVKLVRELNPNGKVYIMEGSADKTTRSNMAQFKYTSDNIPNVTDFIYLEENSGNWEEWDSPLLSKVKVPGNKDVYPSNLNPNKTNDYYLNKIYYEADVIISAPVLKNHCWTSVTGAVKNVGIGATPQNIYGGAKGDNHRYVNNRIDHKNYSNLHKFIHDFYSCKPVDYSIMDGLQGTDYGPVAEKGANLAAAQKNMRLILAGKDAIALDAIASLIMCYDPSKIEHLVLLHNDTLGCIDPKYIRVFGPDLNTIRESFRNYSSTNPKFNDTVAPEVTIGSLSITKTDMQLALQTDAPDDIVKVEVSVDGQTVDKDVIANFGQINIDLSNINLTDSLITIKVFDKYLNCTSIKYKGNTKQTGIDGHHTAYPIRLYPNPVKNILNIDYSNHQTGSIHLSITDISGKTIVSYQLQKQEQLLHYNFDCNHLTKAMYIVSIKQNGRVYTQQFIKQ